MLELYGKSTSINVRKVLWLCEELELKYRHVGGDPSSDADFNARLCRINPNGQVPVLLDGDFALWESNSICRYLAARAQRHDLLPADPRARALVEQWMDWQATDLNSAWRGAFMSRVRRHPDCPDQIGVARNSCAGTASLPAAPSYSGALADILGIRCSARFSESSESFEVSNAKG